MSGTDFKPKRTKIIQVRVTEQEHEAIHNACPSGLSVSAWVRLLALDLAARAKPGVKMWRHRSTG
jgi:hypothetical protein